VRAARGLQSRRGMTTTNKMTAVAFAFVAAATTVAALSSPAHAQTAPSGDPQNVVSAELAAPAAGATASDPNVDRGFVLPTAMTQPAGSITYNNYELLLHGVTYGITDRVQASVTVLSPITRDMPFLGVAAVKGRIVATDRFHLALQGSVGMVRVFDTADADKSGYTAGAGAFASYCLRQDCSSLLSASATYQLAFEPSVVGATHLVLYGGSIVHSVSKHVKLLGEVGSAAGRDHSNDFQNVSGLLVNYGVRFHTDSIAADVGFVKPIATSGDDGGFLVGLPFVNVSYRWQ